MARGEYTCSHCHNNVKEEQCIRRFTYAGNNINGREFHYYCPKCRGYVGFKPMESSINPIRWWFARNRKKKFSSQIIIYYVMNKSVEIKIISDALTKHEINTIEKILLKDSIVADVITNIENQSFRVFANDGNENQETYLSLETHETILEYLRGIE